MLQNALDYNGGHLLHNIHGVVQIQLIQHLLELGVGEAADQNLLLVGIQLYKHLCCQLLGEQTEHQGNLIVHFLAQSGNICCLQGEQKVSQMGILFSFQIILNFFQQLCPLVFQFKHPA